MIPIACLGCSFFQPRIRYIPIGSRSSARSKSTTSSPKSRSCSITKRATSPNNLTFIVVGDVDAERVRQQLADLFKPYPEKSLQPVFIPGEPPQLGRREVHQEFATELTHLSLAWHIPAVTNPDVPALDLLSTILGEGRSSRLYRRVREEAGLAFR